MARHFPALLWAGLIYWLSAQSKLPSASLGWLDFVIKHLAHILVYAGLYFWLWWAQKPRRWLPLIITLLYALSDEYHQSFVPGRYMSLMDLGFDSLGAFGAYLSLNLTKNKDL